MKDWDKATIEELMARQRQYDDIAKRLNGGEYPDPYAAGAFDFHQRIMEILDAEDAKNV